MSVVTSSSWNYVIGSYSILNILVFICFRFCFETLPIVLLRSASRYGFVYGFSLSSGYAFCFVGVVTAKSLSTESLLEARLAALGCYLCSLCSRSSRVNSFSSSPIYSSMLSYKWFLPLWLILFLKLNRLLIISPSCTFWSFNWILSSLRPSFIVFTCFWPPMSSAFSS